jgi:hypothetical protein
MNTTKQPNGMLLHASIASVPTITPLHLANHESDYKNPYNGTAP